MPTYQGIKSSAYLWLAPLLLLIFAPIAVSPASLRPAWDEIFFLHNGVCVAHAVAHHSLKALDGCLGEMAKSPVMAFLLVPGGDMQGDPTKLVIAPFVLALTCFSQVMLLGYLGLRARISPLALVLAALAGMLCRPLRNNGAPFMVDGLFSLVVANLILMMIVEARSPSRDRAQAAWDGFLWAAILSLGMLCKVTFGFFAVFATPVAVILSCRKAGWRLTAIKAAVATVLSLPAGIMMLRYGHLYWNHAAEASFGTLSTFYDDHLSRFAFIRETLTTIRPLLAAVVIFLIWIVLGLRKKRPAPGVAAYGVAIVIAYFLLSSGSPNKDPRFFWPVWVTLPFCLAAMVPVEPVPDLRRRMGTTVPVLLAVALALQNLGRFDFQGINEAVDALHSLPDGPASVEIATDEPAFNIESLLLAQQLDYAHEARKSIGTVVYDVTRKLAEAHSIETLGKADYVIGRFPPSPGAEPWANQYSADFQKSLDESKRPVTKLAEHPTISIYGPIAH